jgi:ABC-type antimicrobial peptide transport system permease subunit
MSLGASRWRLIRQFMTESVLLAFMGAVVGTATAAGAMRLLTGWLASEIPRAVEIRFDGAVFLFLLGTTALAAVLLGSAPAFQISRVNLNDTLKNAGGRGLEVGAHQRWKNLLVAAEIALSFVLLIGAGLLLKTLWQLQHTASGMDAENVLTFRLWLAKNRYPTGAAASRFYRRVLEQIEALPGVDSADAIALALAVSGVYGVMAFVVARRTQEFGIRFALGAQTRDVLRLVFLYGLRWVVVGIGIGLLGAIALTRFLGSLLSGVSPTEPGVYVAVATLLMSAAIAACLIPAYRASRMNPMVALRYE